ncbi:glycoside hydrolase family 27 protein [Sphingomonas sp. 22176]|uniref:glycoside hydrolase family 27 protein n=1 Tax=Sphingomonas sp. 22176 TaxID=3453884 RepID=UPI003F847E64
MPAAAQSAPIGAWVFDNPPAYPEITMLQVRRDGDVLRGTLTSRWYGRIEMQHVVLQDRTLHFDLRNINDPTRPTRHWTARFDHKGAVTLSGGIWHSDVTQTGRRGTLADVRTRTFRLARKLPPRASLAPDALAAVPPMGWSSWNKFADKIDAATIRSIADAMVASGLRDAGYLYVNIDDGWQGVRGRDGTLRPNHRFPDMKALADYVHARGLKLGLYSSPGPRTCAGYEGSYGHVEQDARTFAAWGIDYVKYDLCSGEWFYDTAGTVRQAYYAMGAALRATGRPILYSLCEYGRFDVAGWGRAVGGHLWRTTGDITDAYKTMAEIGFDRNPRFTPGGPGGWNDPDMLEVGNGGMSEDEYRTHITLWAMQAAPLIMGHDLRTMSAATKAILENSGVIAIDQDRLGAQGQRVRTVGAIEIWRKPLADGAIALAIFNRGMAAGTIDLLPADMPGTSAGAIKDIFEGEPTTVATRFTVAAHGVRLLRIAPSAPAR